MERETISAKHSPENIEFLEDWGREFRPYPISDSALVDLCVSIVRTLRRKGTISLEPGALQGLLSAERNGSKERNESTGTTSKKK